MGNCVTTMCAAHEASEWVAMLVALSALCVPLLFVVWRTWKIFTRGRRT